MDDVTYERNKTGVKDYSNAEFKIISAQAEEAQKVLNQWRHMYDLEIIDVKVDRYGTSEWFKADMQWFTILVARQDKRFK